MNLQWTNPKKIKNHKLSLLNRHRTRIWMHEKKMGFPYHAWVASYRRYSLA